jgi:hypothetical protein
MGENERDAKFVNDLLRRLPTGPVSSALQARILADFDSVATRRKPGALWRLAQRWRDRVWPGAPVWQPISLLAFSLAIGLMAGTLVPTSTLTSTTTTTDQTLASVDSTTAMDLYKDL